MRKPLVFTLLLAAVLLAGNASAAASRLHEQRSRVVQNERERDGRRIPVLRRLLALVGLADTLIGPLP